MATGGYSGYLPYAPGTWGSLVGLLLVVCLTTWPHWLYLLVLGGCAVGGIWIAGQAEQLLGGKDPAPIVIDEIAGILLTYYALPLSPWLLLLGFVSFRAFDVYKPCPQLERLPAGWGIMIDDLVAGVLAQSGLRLMWTLMDS